MRSPTDRVHFAFVQLLVLGTALVWTRFLPAPSWEQKWITVFGLTLGVLIWSLRDRATVIFYPRLSGAARIGAVLAVTGVLISFCLNLDHVSWVRVAERLCFFVLLIYFFNQSIDVRSKCLSHLEIATYVTLAVLITAYLWRYRACRASDGWALRCPAPFFENRNMFVQALELTLILLTLTMCRHPKPGRWRLVGYVFASTLTVTVCVLSHSRSSLLALCLFAFVAVFAKVLRRLERSRVLAYSAVVIVAVIWLIDARTELVDSSGSLRLSLLGAALRVGLHHPWGIGLGFYPWVEWRERLSPAEQFVRLLFYKSPHNEILRLAAEEGWITAVGAYVVLFDWVRRSAGTGFWFRLTKTSFAIFLACETLLQFPFENPFPTVAMSCLLAYLAPRESIGRIKVNVSVKSFVLSVVVFLNVVICAELYAFGRGRIFTARDSLDRMVCAFTPEFWPLCLELGRTLKRKGNYGAGRKVLRAVLRRQPNNVWTFAELMDGGLEVIPDAEAYDQAVERILSEEQDALPSVGVLEHKAK